jgi:hypothetical protein
MAEFMNAGDLVGMRIDDTAPDTGTDGFGAMGKPIPPHRRQAAYEHVKAMGVKDSDQAMTLVGTVADQLERDKPYEAMAAGMKHIDLTGTYRLMAVLLTAQDPS